MGQGANAGVVCGAAMMSMALAAPALAADVSTDVDMTPYLGTWGDGSGYNCESRGGDETAPLVIERNYLGGYLVGAYEFSCSLLNIEQRRASVAADTSCGHEGTDETSTGRIELGLMSDGHLVMANGGLNVLTRCETAAN